MTRQRRVFTTGLAPAHCSGACESGSQTGRLQRLGRQYQHGRGVNAHLLAHNRANEVRLAVEQYIRETCCPSTDVAASSIAGLLERSGMDWAEALRQARELTRGARV
ncbi:MAG: hypothetical protein JRI80_00440 [Deltaproteobacteria bacterium]|nr:hypothetical protein [Deltaproteobacteria bacterium]